MADTGYNWDAAFTTIDATTVLTQGGTDADTSAVIDLDGKVGCIISIDVDYSDHVKATGGLFVYVLEDINGTDYQIEADEPWGFEMPFVQNGTRRKPFTVDPGQVSKFKLLLDWDNSTGSSVATVATMIKYATVPPAS